MQPGVDPFWKFLWSISLPKKQLLFMWKLFHQAIPTVDVLKSHHLMVTGLCRFGCKVEESIHHLFFSCDLTKSSWFGCFSIRSPCHLSTEDILLWLRKFLLDHSDNMSLVKGIIALINDIWLKRNKAVHGGKVPQTQDIIRDS